MGKMTRDQYGYFKCSECMTNDDYTKKDVYYDSTTKKMTCKHHGGSGVLVKSKDAVLSEAPPGQMQMKKPVKPTKR